MPDHHDHHPPLPTRDWLAVVEEARKETILATLSAIGWEARGIGGMTADEMLRELEKQREIICGRLNN